MNHGEGTGGLEVVDESLGWGGRGEGWRDGREGRVPVDLDPSDSAAVASTAASTRRTAAQTCPILKPPRRHSALHMSIRPILVNTKSREGLDRISSNLAQTMTWT